MMIVTLSLLIAIALFANADVNRQRLCGKSLIRHVSKSCYEHECPAEVDVSWLAAEIDPATGFQGLARQCCLHGCSQAMVNGYCCIRQQQEMTAVLGATAGIAPQTPFRAGPKPAPGGEMNKMGPLSEMLMNRAFGNEAMVD